MSKFKRMKFWIGDDRECGERVYKMLLDLGYRVVVPERLRELRTSRALYTDTLGCIGYGGALTGFHPHTAEEINIDWLRSDKRKTVQIGDKSYYEDELATALANIKPVDG